MVEDPAKTGEVLDAFDTLPDLYPVGTIIGSTVLTIKIIGHTRMSRAEGAYPDIGSIRPGCVEIEVITGTSAAVTSVQSQVGQAVNANDPESDIKPVKPDVVLSNPVPGARYLLVPRDFMELVGKLQNTTAA